MNGLIAVAAGGAIGASLRYVVTLAFARGGSTAFPWHTFGVNVIGAFALGLLMAVLPEGEAAEQWRLFIGVGLLGGFTTFSTFGVEFWHPITFTQNNFEFRDVLTMTRGEHSLRMGGESLRLLFTGP